MKKFKVVTAVALALSLVALGAARAADFSPKMTFSISDTKTKANPSLTVTVEQDEGEEELGTVTLKIPKGFDIPSDEEVPDGDTLGTGTINIHVGPGCRPDVPVKELDTNLTLPAELVEADRTDDQQDSGLYAVWILDISGVTTVPLQITGSPKTGFTMYGEIAPNDNTCPPFSFELTIDQQSESGVPIFTNPKKPGKKVFSGTLTSVDSPASVTIKQVIKITR